MLLVLEMFRTSLLLATHSKTHSNSLLRVSVTSLAVDADASMVESSAYMDTHALFNASGRSLLRIDLGFITMSVSVHVCARVQRCKVFK